MNANVVKIEMFAVVEVGRVIFLLFTVRKRNMYGTVQESIEVKWRVKPRENDRRFVKIFTAARNSFVTFKIDDNFVGARLPVLAKPQFARVLHREYCSRPRTDLMVTVLGHSNGTSPIWLVESLIRLPHPRLIIAASASKTSR